jgi:ADP-heptose:LPS heptosyltransferase
LLLWAEQGIGDEVFFAGLLPAAQRDFTRISLVADERLHPVFKRSFPTVNLLGKSLLHEQYFDTGFDCQAPIGDLFSLLKLDEQSVRSTRASYLKVNLERRKSYFSYFEKSKMICGIAWESSNKQFGTLKSLDLKRLKELLRLPDFQFVNLQYGSVDVEIDRVRADLGVDIQQIPGLDIFNDIDGLLALIDACDVVVTSSNVTAHLAGAIGKRAAVLVPYGKGRLWYWHDNDEYSFWYPSLRLFYQDSPADWGTPINNCVQWIRSLQ